MKYVMNKKIMWIPIIFGIIIFSTLIIQEGTNIIGPTETIICSELSYDNCKNPLYNIEDCLIGKEHSCQKTITPGTTININQQKNKLIPILNYGIWILIIKVLLINHILYNRKYPIIKKIKEIIKTLKENEDNK